MDTVRSETVRSCTSVFLEITIILLNINSSKQWKGTKKMEGITRAWQPELLSLWVTNYLSSITQTRSLYGVQEYIQKETDINMSHLWTSFKTEILLGKACSKKVIVSLIFYVRLSSHTVNDRTWKRELNGKNN